MKREEERIYPAASLLMYSTYASMMRSGARTYPQQCTDYDLEVRSSGDCFVCAHGALVAGMVPSIWEDIIHEKKANLRQTQRYSNVLWQTSIRQIQIWTGQSHPLLWNRRVDCPLQKTQMSIFREDLSLFPEKLQTWTPHRFTSRVSDMIVHLNDEHLWTIEQTAYWLESLDALEDRKEEE